MYTTDARWLNSHSTGAKQREVEPYDDIMFVYWLAMTPFSRLFVGIASFASALIKYKYGRTYNRTSDDYYTLSLDIRASIKCKNSEALQTQAGGLPQSDNIFGAA